MHMHSPPGELREVVCSGGQEAGPLEGFDQAVIETNIGTSASHQLCARNRRENGSRLIGRSVAGDDRRLDEGPCEPCDVDVDERLDLTFTTSGRSSFSAVVTFAIHIRLSLLSASRNVPGYRRNRSAGSGIVAENASSAVPAFSQ